MDVDIRVSQSAAAQLEQLMQLLEAASAQKSDEVLSSSDLNGRGITKAALAEVHSELRRVLSA